MTAHIIFDLNMDAGFTSKARFVADVNRVYMPYSMMYASFVSRDSFQIVLIFGIP